MTAPAKTYPSERAADLRAAQLRELGIWTGVVRAADGSRRLMHDPDTAGQRPHRTTAEDRP